MLVFRTEQSFLVVDAPSRRRKAFHRTFGRKGNGVSGVREGDLSEFIDHANEELTRFGTKRDLAKFELTLPVNGGQNSTALFR